MARRIAASFDFKPQPEGTVIIEFYDDHDNTCGVQVITGQAFVSIPLVAFITLTAMKQGPDVAAKLIRVMRAAEEAEDGIDQ